VASGGALGEIFLDLNHYTVRGHELIARELRDLLRETGILPAGPGH
jgi:hypothetical protein